MSQPTPTHHVVFDAELAGIDLEKLGRQRPAVFSSIWHELCFAFSLLGSMAMSEYFISGFHIVLPLLSSELHLSPAAQTWPSSVFTLAAAACLLPLGRLSDLRGAYPVFVAGLAWAALACLGAGFCRSYAALVACRALTGVGAAAFLPAGITLIGKTYRPGPRKNLVFALYGAFAPLGFFAGILLGGVAGQYLDWRWYFWIGAAAMAAICAAGAWAVPRDFGGSVPEGEEEQERRRPVMDWWGTLTVVPGLVLVVYGITESSQAARGWASPHILATVVGGTLLLAAAVYVEGWVATDPLLPADLFAAPYMKRLVGGLFLAYGAFGVFLFYSSFYLEVVLGRSPLQTAVWYLPMVGCGLVLGAVGGLTLHRLPGRALLVLSGLGFVVASLLFALMPAGDPSYWAWVMPAMIAASVGIDVAFTVSNVFITTNLPLRRQGLAGALINSTLFLGISVLLGFGNVAVARTSHLPLRESYQVAFWMAVGVSGAALCIFSTIDLGQAKSQLTLEEREQMDLQNNRQGSKPPSHQPSATT